MFDKVREILYRHMDDDTLEAIAELGAVEKDFEDIDEQLATALNRVKELEAVLAWYGNEVARMSIGTQEEYADAACGLIRDKGQRARRILHNV